MAEAQPEVLARHWAGAGEAMPAIAAWKKAADAAYARRAFKEAEEGYPQALAMVKTLAESPERDALELELASALVGALFITKGYTAAESIESAARAAALAEKTGNLASLILQAFGAWGAVYASDDLIRSAALANQLLDLANREGSSTSLAFAHNAQVLSRYNHGDLVGVEEHFGRLNRFCEAPLYQQFVGANILALSYGALAAFRLGHMGSAGDRIAQAVAAAQASKNPYELALVRFFEAMMYQDLRDRQRSEAVSVEALAIAEEHGFPFLRDLALINLGWTRAHLGGAAEGVALIRKGLSGLVAIGARLGFPLYLTYLAEAQKLDGAIDDALATIEDALQANPDEIIYLPETLRCRGELRLELAHTELAEADFREAIAVAQQMTAKILELRATTSLARLLANQGHCEEARAMLADVYNWFTEGFDTADLKDAKALLDELSESQHPPASVARR